MSGICWQSGRVLLGPLVEAVYYAFSPTIVGALRMPAQHTHTATTTVYMLYASSAVSFTLCKVLTSSSSLRCHDTDNVAYRSQCSRGLLVTQSAGVETVAHRQQQHNNVANVLRAALNSIVAPKSELCCEALCDSSDAFRLNLYI